MTTTKFVGEVSCRLLSVRVAVPASEAISPEGRVLFGTAAVMLLLESAKYHWKLGELACGTTVKLTVPSRRPIALAGCVRMPGSPVTVKVTSELVAELIWFDTMTK